MNSKKQWKILSQEENKTTDEIITTLLHNRGMTTKKEIEAFLNPKLEEVTVKSVNIDAKQLAKAVQRIEKAKEKKGKIIVYGDYDVDGITGTAILWESLFKLGLNVIPYIPHRIDEGYGLSQKGIENILHEHPDTTLILTVDNGIVANEAVTFANKKGIDVIITDHHTVGKTLPKAHAIVHTTLLCGAGVGWMLTQALKNKNEALHKDHLSLVALATVADLVPLTGANRTLLIEGLKELKKTQRPGLLALFNEAQIDKETIDVYAIGHAIAPRLNAMGRLDSAMDSLRLLCTKDRLRAKVLADTLGRTNTQRQQLTSSTIEHAKQQVFALKEKKKIIFIEHDRYEEGVIGLVAGRLVEEFYLPSIVIAKKKDISKASARSIAGFNIIDAIRKASKLLVNAGGHPMAAGFTVMTKNLPELKKLLEKIAEEAIDNDLLTRILKIDCDIPLALVNKKLFGEIEKLSPFGMGNPEPAFLSEAVISEIKLIGKDSSHLKLELQLPSTPQKIQAVAFGMGTLFRELKKGSKITCAYAISENTWNGKTNLQLKIKDIQSISK